jgi:hypothetical protein
LLEPARSRIGRLKTYNEISPSGTGVHCICWAKPGEVLKLNGQPPGHDIEIYSRGRYFTFTGQPVNGHRGEMRNAAADVSALVIEGRPQKAVHEEASPGVGFEYEWQDEKSYWWNSLTPEKKDAAVRSMLGVLAEKTNLLQLTQNGGNNDDYYRLITSLSQSGAPHAEDLFVEYAIKVPGADAEDVLREKFQACKRQADGRITVGTLLAWAK